MHAFLEQGMDRKAISLIFITTTGPDCLKDIIPKYGIWLKLYKHIKEALTHSVRFYVLCHSEWRRSMFTRWFFWRDSRSLGTIVTYCTLLVFLVFYALWLQQIYIAWSSQMLESLVGYTCGYSLCFVLFWINAQTS